MAVLGGLGAGMGLLLDPDTLIGQAAAAQRRRAAAQPAQHADRHLRGADDGEPLVRPLPGLAAGGRRAPGGPDVHRRLGHPAPHPPPHPRLPGLRVPRPRPLLGGRPHRDGRRQDGRLPQGPERRVLDRLLHRARPPLHPERRPGVHRLRPLLLLAALVDLSEPRVHARRAVVRDDRQHAAEDRLPRHDDLQRAEQEGRVESLLLHRPARGGAVGRARRGARGPRAGVLPALQGRASCPRSPSWTPRSRTRTAAPRATSTRTATCAPARRSWPTWCTPSWSRRSGRPARCSSSTTSGAASSTTCARRACRTTARARTSTKDFGQMGFRIPAVAVSPWVRRGHVDHTIYGFESILKMIEYRYGLAPLTRRDKYARNIARSFDFESKPRLDPPHLPTPAHVMSHACAVPGLALPEPRRGAAGAGAAGDPHTRPAPRPHGDAHQRLPRPARLQVPARHRGHHLPPAGGNHRRGCASAAPRGRRGRAAAGPQPDGPRLGRAGHAHGRRTLRRRRRRRPSG